MAIGVDTSKWKPRSIKGTPAAKFRNVLAFSILSFGIFSGLVFQYSNVTKNLKKATEVFYEDPIEEVERRMMIASGLPNRSTATIRKYEKEFKRIDRPDV